MRLSYSETVPHIILHLLEVIAGTTRPASMPELRKMS